MVSPDPAPLRPAAQRVVGVEEPAIAERASILIVDDLPDKLLVFRTVLEELDQELVCVRSGEEALREVLLREFAVILLDVNMPDLDGFETAALIRSYKRSAHTPIIFITSYVDEMQTARGYSLGAVDYILSPVVPPVLRSKVQVFVRLFVMQRQIRRQADAERAFAAGEAARRVAEENDRRSEFLSTASRLLNRSLEARVIRREFAGLVVPRYVSLAALVLRDAEPSVANALVAYTDASASGAVLMEMPEAALPPSLREALRRGESGPQRITLSGDEFERVAEQSIAFTGNGMNAAQLRSGVVLPLCNGDRSLGAALLITTGEPGSSPVDWGTIEELAGRASAAFENARLYRSLEREIVDRIAAEAQLQEASRRKDEFLAMLSHELRNPLAPTLTALEVLCRVGQPGARFTWAADIMKRQLRQMTRLIDELLDVARISQGKIALVRERVDLNAVLAQSVESARPFIDAREQTLQLSPPGEPLWLQADAARLAQVISNLLNNASKYSDKQSMIELRASSEHGEAVIAVRDEGLGIDSELLPRVFELFTQGSRSLDRSQGGLGVGLTLARRLAELHGGRLNAFSDGAGRGSTFVLRLPCISLVRPIDEVMAEVVAPKPTQVCKILVVDDNRDAALTTATFLELYGHEMRTAADGAQALDVATAFAPDVVVLDIGLPSLDGYEVARRLRQLPVARDAFLIALTGYGQRDDRLAADAAGFDRHFVKPASPAELRDCIAAWLHSRRAHPVSSLPAAAHSDRSHR